MGFAFLAAIVSLIPLWYLGIQSLSRGTQAFIDELFQERTLTLVWRSGVLTAAVTCASIVI